jgi:hypothetical protein
MKMLMGRVSIRWPDPNEERLRYRRKRYAKRMELSGVRPASIQRYLARGFKGPWVRALHAEMERLVWDIKYRSLK